MNKKRRDGATALLLSVQMNRLECTRHLLLHPQIRVSVRSLFPERLTPLVLAIRLRRTEQLALLLQSPAITMDDNLFERETPLEYARSIAVDDDGADESVSVAIQRAIKLLKSFESGGCDAVESLIIAEGDSGARAAPGSGGGGGGGVTGPGGGGEAANKSVRFDEQGAAGRESAPRNEAVSRLLLRQPNPQSSSSAPISEPAATPTEPASGSKSASGSPSKAAGKNSTAPSPSHAEPPNFDRELKLLRELAEMDLPTDARSKLAELTSALKKRAGVSEGGDGDLTAAADKAMKNAANSARARARTLLKKKGGKA